MYTLYVRRQGALTKERHTQLEKEREAAVEEVKQAKSESEQLTSQLYETRRECQVVTSRHPPRPRACLSALQEHVF
jgi:chromosome segregation ATPase